MNVIFDWQYIRFARKKTRLLGMIFHHCARYYTTEKIDPNLGSIHLPPILSEYRADDGKLNICRSPRSYSHPPPVGVTINRTYRRKDIEENHNISFLERFLRESIRIFFQKK